MVQPLLSALAKGVQAAASGVCRVVLTLNVPEAAPLPPPQGWPFVLQIIRNTQPSGFGALAYGTANGIWRIKFYGQHIVHNKVFQALKGNI